MPVAPGPALPVSITLHSRAGTRSVRGWSLLRGSSSSPGPQVAKHAGGLCWCPGRGDRWTQNRVQGMGDCCCLPSHELHCLLSPGLSSLGITLPMHMLPGEPYLAGPGLSLDTGHRQMLPFAGPRQEGHELQPVCRLQSSWAQVCHLLEEGPNGKAVSAVAPAAAVCCMQQHAPLCPASSTLHSQGCVPLEARSGEELTKCSVPDGSAGRHLMQQTEAHEYPLSFYLLCHQIP